MALSPVQGSPADALIVKEGRGGVVQAVLGVTP